MRGVGTILAAVLLAACGGSVPSGAPGSPAASGGIGSPAAGSPAASTPTASAGESRSTEPSGAPASPPISAAPFVLASDAFAAGAPIPRRYTCDGPDASPPLRWSGVPAGTAELDLLVVDPDANGFVHWVAAGIPATAGGLAAGASGTKAIPAEGRNTFGRLGWSGPCPPSGTHHYRFTLYAASTRLGLRDGITGDQLRAAVEGVTLAKATLVGAYARG